MAYNYYEELKNDIEEYLEDNDITLTEDNFGEVEDDLWTEDSVTGNGSGSYTFSRQRAKENLEGNGDLVREMAVDFDCKDKVLDWFLDDDYESIDVSVRCYLLNRVLWDILKGH